MKSLVQITSSSKAAAEEWRARTGPTGNIVLGWDNVESLLSRWHPLNDLYVSQPGCSDFIKAIDLEEFKGKIYFSYVLRSRLSILISTIAAMAIAFIGKFKNNAEVIHLSFAMIFIAIFMAADYFVSTRSADTLIERSRFYLFVKERCGPDIVIWFAFMILIETVQLIAEALLGNFEILIMNYGSFYKSIENGEWWRLLTGPFLHVNTLHWFANLATLVLIVGLAATISRRLTFLVFLFSSIAGSCAGWLFSSLTHQDGYAGISGGIFGIYGMCASFAFYRASEFPEKFCYVLGGFGLLNILIPATINSHSSVEGHVAGFLTGLVLGAIAAQVIRFKTPPAQSSRAPCSTRPAHAPAADSPH